jgi:hypothetical protein
MRQTETTCPDCPLGSRPGCSRCRGTGTVTRWETTLDDRLGAMGSKIALVAFWVLALVAVTFIAVSSVLG